MVLRGAAGHRRTVSAASAPGGCTPSPARCGQPGTTAGAGRSPPRVRHRPSPRGAATSTRAARPPHVCADRAVADAQCRGDLLVAAPKLVLQAHHFSNVRHGQPHLSHRLPPFLDRPLRGWKNAPLPKAFRRRYSLTTGWMACVGIRKFMQAVCRGKVHLPCGCETRPATRRSSW